MPFDPVQALEDRIRATFEQVQTSGPLERDTILTTIGADDPDVHRAVVRMLEALEAPAFSPQELISGRFRIVRLLGKGGMGEVYEADDAVLRERVALKTLPFWRADDGRAVERLKREIALARRVTHPNVCRVFDVDQHQSDNGVAVTFFTMELLNGQTLSARLRERGRMTAAEALPLLRQMAHALGAAHVAGVVHGDFKPGNAMLVSSERENAERLVVTDFGLAHPAEPSTAALTVTAGGGWGTPMYMAPEQLANDRLTPQTDIYALGVVAREMVGGELDARWSRAIARCLEREPRDRFATAVDFVDALNAPVSARTAVRWGVIATAIALLAGGAAIWRWPALRFGSAAVRSVGRSIAVLPFVEGDATADNAAFNRGLAIALSDQVHVVSALDNSAGIWPIPTEEVIEGDLHTQESARKTLGVDDTVMGRIVRNPHDRGIGMTMQVGDRHESIQLPAGDRVLPAAMTHVASLLGLRLSRAVLAKLKEGGTTSQDAEAWYLKGRGYLSQRQEGVDAAIDALQRARQADSTFALATAALSEAYRLKYAYTREPAFIELAQRVGDDGIRLNATLAYAHVVRGSIYRDTGQHERALREFQAALAVDASALNGRQRLAESYEAQGSLREAEESYRQEIASYPRYWMPRVDFGSFLIRHGRYADAESQLLTAAQNAPDNTRVIGNLAGFYLLTERFAAAEAELRHGLEIATSAIGLNNLGWVYIYQGQMERALPVLEQAVKSPGADSTHWSSLARAYRWTNQAAQARTTYETAITLARREVGVNPRNTRIRANLASLLAETGQRREALEELASTLERAPTDVSVLFRSAVVQELIGDRAGALKALAAATRGGYSAIEIRRYPDLARLRDDPRFLDLLTMTRH